MAQYRTPGVYVEEVSSGVRPVTASSTTDTGFVGIITLPPTFVRGSGEAAGMVLPSSASQVGASWNRALAFRALSGPEEEEVKPETKVAGKTSKSKSTSASSEVPEDDNRLRKMIKQSLGQGWSIAPADGDASLTLRDADGVSLRMPVRRALLSVRQTAASPEWDLAYGIGDQAVIGPLASFAAANGIQHTGALDCVAPAAKSTRIDASSIQSRLQRTAATVTSVEAFAQWRREFSAELFQELLLEADSRLTEARAESTWDTLSAAAQDAWFKWLRAHPGMFRLELAVRGFFTNGGRAAYIALGVQTEGAAGAAKHELLNAAFGSLSTVAMICAPGLDFAWQRSLLEYSGPRGRADLFAVLDAPRYLLTRAPRGANVGPARWSEGDGPYEMGSLQTVASARSTELRFTGYSDDMVLDRAVPRDDTGHGASYGPWLVVENHLSTGAHDRYVICPPAGHVAGVIAATDLKASGGVHKAPANEIVAGVEELVTDISDREQEVLNIKGVNIIRRRPSGIRIWGARTTAADPLWTYVNVRRLFLFVERSVRESIQWAVFLPNNDATRSDLGNSITTFLFQLYHQGMLDGESWRESFSVVCDRSNNPDADVRSGILTADISLRPVYPAEFIRLRFRQAAPRAAVS